MWTKFHKGQCVATLMAALLSILVLLNRSVLLYLFDQFHHNSMNKTATKSILTARKKLYFVHITQLFTPMHLVMSLTSLLDISDNFTWLKCFYLVVVYISLLNSIVSIYNWDTPLHLAYDLMAGQTVLYLVLACNLLFNFVSYQSIVRSCFVKCCYRVPSVKLLNSSNYVVNDAERHCSIETSFLSTRL